MTDEVPPHRPSAGSRPYQADPAVAQVGEILDRSYLATSTDGVAAVSVGGDQRVRSAELVRTDVSAAMAGAALTTAVNTALQDARTQTVQAMCALPGLDPQLKALMQDASVGQQPDLSSFGSAAPIDPAHLDVEHEVTSPDGNVTVTVNGRTQKVTAVQLTSNRTDGGLDAVVVAINAALDAAGSAGAKAKLHADLADIRAALDDGLGQVEQKLEHVSAELDAMLKSL